MMHALLILLAALAVLCAIVGVAACVVGGRSDRSGAQLARDYWMVAIATDPGRTARAFAARRAHHELQAQRAAQIAAIAADVAAIRARIQQSPPTSPAA